MFHLHPVMRVFQIFVAKVAVPPLLLHQGRLIRFRVTLRLGELGMLIFDVMSTGSTRLSFFAISTTSFNLCC